MAASKLYYPNYYREGAKAGHQGFARQAGGAVMIIKDDWVPAVGIIFGFWPFDWSLNFQREGRGFHSNFGPFVLTVVIPPRS